MVHLLDYLRHRRDCRRKQAERASIIAHLPPYYQQPLVPSEHTLLRKPIQGLVHDVQDGVTTPLTLLCAYGKAAVAAHRKTNCLTEVLLTEAEEWVDTGEINLQGPLAGIPVSLKDTVAVGGFDVSVGYSVNTGKPYERDGAVVRILKDAGAIPFVKTNLPITLLSFESTNDVWGRTTNPHNDKYSPGGSTGGEAALLASGGSRIGIGSDVAGSVRVPAHFSGCYSLRCSTGRWPRSGVSTSMPGQEGIPSVLSPMARTLDDLHYFTASFIGMRPWKYDCTVHPIVWRKHIVDKYLQKTQLHVGVMRTDGVVDPSPACARALEEVASALGADGHNVFDVSPPSPFDALKIASHLLNSDGCRTFRSPFRPGEWNDAGAAQMSFYMRLPRLLKYLHYLWVKYAKRDPMWAEILRGWHEKSAYEQWKLVAKREAYRAKWHEWWREETAMDFLITVPHATPAVPHNGMKEAVSSCGYTFLFNLLDYTCGVVPVTHVDSARDALPASFKFSMLNGIAKGAYTHYDAVKMDGLPVGVQVVGQRLQEEKVIAAMERVEAALEKTGHKYQLLEIE